MAELGLIAAVVQVADVGIRLSGKLYTFGQTVASADESIVFISKDVSNTCSILTTLGHSLEKDREEHSYSRTAIDTADTIVKECLEIFHEMDRALLKKITRMGLDGSSSRVAAVALERLKWPFLKPRMMLLWSHLDKLKSSLQLMLNVFIYARLLVERIGDPSVVKDQRDMIEHLLRMTTEQTDKHQSLKAAMDRNESLDVTGASTNGYAQAGPDLNPAMIPTEAPHESKIKEFLEATEGHVATAPVENYCNLIQRIIDEVEADGYSIGHDMRSRIRDDVIHTHKRETRLLRAVYGHTELKEKMRGKSWGLAEIAEEEEKEAEQSQIENRVQSSANPVIGPFGDSWPQDPNLNHSSHDGGIQKQLGECERPREQGRMATTNQARASESYHPLVIFLDNPACEDPWNPLKLTYETPKIEKSKAADERGWLPFLAGRASNLASRSMLFVNPLQPFTQNDDLPQLHFLRSGTSMLVTDQSHAADTIASSQDLAALTDSTDTDTFVSAQSEIGEQDLDSQALCMIEGAKEGPLMVLGDHESNLTSAKDPGMLRVTNLDPSLDELLVPCIDST